MAVPDWIILRCASLAWHDLGYPGQLALLNHKDEKVVQAFIATFNNDIAAKEWAATQSPTGASFAKRSFLSGPVLKQLAKHILQVQDQMPDDLKQWASDFWSGLLQTVCSERANKVLREVATKDCASKTVSRIKRWEAVQRSTLAAVYKRERLNVTDFKPVPSDVVELMDAMFTHTDSSPPLPFKRILDKQDWETFNSVSIRATYAEQFIMREAYRLRDATLFTESWRAAFIPSGSVSDISWKHYLIIPKNLFEIIDLYFWIVVNLNTIVMFICIHIVLNIHMEKCDVNMLLYESITTHLGTSVFSLFK